MLQESNTFLQQATTLAHFHQDLWAVGDVMRDLLQDAHHEVGGFFAGLAETGCEAVPILAARAFPFGTISGPAFAAILEQMSAACDAAGPLDGLLVAPHGATVSADYPDADGHWLTQLRARYGPDMPIIGTLDLHANVSPAMVDACQALIAYRTNPHIDQRERGREAAHMMARTLRGEIRPVMAAAFPPLAIGIERQHTAEYPCTELVARAAAQRQTPQLLSNSILLGFPYADVAEMGSCALAVADGSLDLAQCSAQELADCMWSLRHDFVGEFLTIAQAIDRAAQLDGPVCLLDMGDNVGGGSPGDATDLATALWQSQLGPSFVCLYDPETVQQAQQRGIGAWWTASLGGKTDHRHGAPLSASVQVISLHDGKFRESEPRHGGMTTFDQGATAILRTAGPLTVMVTSRRMVPFSLQQLLACHLNPHDFRLLVAKGVHAPVAAYQTVCKHFIRVNTPGVTCADMTCLDFQHRRRPLYPFERDF